MTDSTAQSETLLPCPFCAKPAHYEHRNSFHQIQCIKRGCVIVEVVEDNYQEAAKRWNTRASMRRAEARGGDAAISEIVRELRDDYPAVDVTTVVFSAGFSGVGCCVIPQDRVLAIIAALSHLPAADATAEIADQKPLGPCTQAEIDAWIETIDSKNSRLLLMWMDRALKAEAALSKPPEPTSP